MAVEMGRALARMSSDLPELIPLSTSYPAIANAPLPAEGSASFSNIHLAIAVLAVPWIFTKLLPFRTGWTSYFILTALLFLPVTGGYWIFMSKYGERINEKVPLPGRPLDHYIELKSLTMRQWEGKMIPMQIFHDAFFDGKAEFKGDVLEVMEYRHEWASFEFTMEVRLHISSISGSCPSSYSDSSSPISYRKSLSTRSPKTRSRSAIITTGAMTSTLGSSVLEWYIHLA